MQYTFKEIDNARKETEWWFRRFLLQPLFALCTWVVANSFSFISPNFISFFTLCFGLFSGTAFFVGYIRTGAIFFFCMILFDAVDGAFARLTGQDSKFGAFFDNFVGSLGFLPIILGIGTYEIVMMNDFSWFFILILFYFFWNFKFAYSLLFAHITGQVRGESGKISVGMDIFSRIKRFLLRHKIREPFAEKDMAILGLVIGPFTPYFKELMIIATIGLFINSCMWMMYYFIVLWKKE